MKATLSRYLVAAYVSAGAAALMFLLQALSTGSTSKPFLPFGLVAALMVGWFVGIGPGMFSLAMTVLAAVYLYVTVGPISAGDSVRIGLFAILGAALVVVASRRRRALIEADLLAVSNKELAERVAGQLDDRKREASDLARGEAAVAASEARLRELVQSAPVILWEVNLMGVITFVDGRGLDVLGMDARTLLGRTLSDLLGESPTVLERVQQAYRGETVALLAPLGSYIYETTYSPRREADRSISGLVAVSVDVTERERLTDALRRSQDRFRFALEAGRIGVWTWQPDTRTLWWSERMEMLHGLQAGQFQPSLSAYAGLVDRADWPAVLRLIEMTEGEGHCDYWTTWPNGERRRISLTARRHDEDGLSRVLGVAVDITARELEQRETARIATVRARGEAVAEAASRLARVLDRDIAHSITLLNEVKSIEGIGDLAPLVEDAIAGLTRAMTHADSFEQVARIHGQGGKSRKKPTTPPV